MKTPKPETRPRDATALLLRQGLAVVEGVHMGSPCKKVIQVWRRKYKAPAFAQRHPMRS
jgi:hypothetical protein